jgi:transcription elongation GreA/GreB family factor
VEKNSRPDQIFTYRLLATGEQKTIRLTNEWEADPNQDCVSFTSPLGLALWNKKVGQIVEIQIGQKKYQIQIITIK